MQNPMASGGIKEVSEALNVITLSRDNFDELELTLKSVYMQSERPSRHIVIDSSSVDSVSRVEAISRRFGAEYFWIPAEGIYPAMEFSLTLMRDSDYALWLNSSDWFAGSNAIKELRAQLSDDSHSTPWLAGQLLRWSPSELGIHQVKDDAVQALAGMRLGLSGFPHPSVVFSVSAVRKAGGYVRYRWMRVAQDYALALRMGRIFGPPKQTPLIVSIHVPMGFTTSNKSRSFWERVASRLLENPFPYVAASIALIPLLALRALRKNIAGGVVRNKRTLNGLVPAHFCVDGDDKEWPWCCATALGALRVYPGLRLRS